MEKKKQKIVVSLTSHAERINTVHKVVESLWNQKICADEIILYLSLLEFPQKEKKLPFELTGILGKKGFKIRWVEENLKSHKKYFYVLQEYREDIVITIDDDMEYSESFISDLIIGHKEFPHAIVARRARIILREQEQLVTYKEWDNRIDEYSGVPRTDLCAIGVGGVLYPPTCATKRWFDKEQILLCAPNQDDLWLKYNEVLENIPVVLVRPTGIDKSIESVQNVALSRLNIQAGENDLCIKRLAEWVQNVEHAQYNKWFVGLMQKERYITIKKSYYAECVKKVLNKELPLYLYGAGKRAKRILDFFKEVGLLEKLEGILVSKKFGNPDNLHGIQVIQIDELNKGMVFEVVYGVGKNYYNEIECILKEYNCQRMILNLEPVLRYYND